MGFFDKIKGVFCKKTEVPPQIPSMEQINLENSQLTQLETKTVESIINASPKPFTQSSQTNDALNLDQVQNMTPAPIPPTKVLVSTNQVPKAKAVKRSKPKKKSVARKTVKRTVKVAKKKVVKKRSSGKKKRR